MTRPKRRGGPVLAAGLGGFVLGAATVLFVVWVYGGGHAGPAGGEGLAPGTPRAPALPARPGAPPWGGAGPGGGTTGGGEPPAARPGEPVPGLAPPGASPPGEQGADVEELRRRRLLLPVQGVRPEQLRDSFAEGRSGHVHEALDIMAQRDTPVLAVEDGRLAKLFLSARGGNTIYQFDPSETYAYYYAHLDRYAAGLREGDALRRGQVVGYVGTTGNAPANAPHLHFAIFRLTPEKHWWQGTAIDPFFVFEQR